MGERDEGAPSMGTSVSFDEMEAQLAEGKPGSSDLSATLSGEGVPDDLKGKPIKDIIAEINARKATDAAAQAGREAAQRAIAAAQPAPAPAPVRAEPEPEKELSEEELTKLYEENPVAAIKKMNEQAERRVMKNMEGRIAPMTGGFAQMAEQKAREKFADEFELFGAEIQQIIGTLPNPALMSNPKAWDDLIGLVRGRPGNFEKLLTHIKTKTAGAGAQADQAAGAGFHAPPRNPGPAEVRGQLTDVQRAVAREMDMTDEEYLFWGRDTR